MDDVNAPSGQTPTMAPPVRVDDQILPHIRWVPIGKSNCYLDMEKSQSNPIYKIPVDLLKNTNFLRAFTASSIIPSIYIQQFWDTILYDKKAGCYKCQLDEQWFDLTKETLREALQITPVNHNQAFAAPPSIDGLIDFVNQLGYPKGSIGSTQDPTLHSTCLMKSLFLVSIVVSEVVMDAVDWAMQAPLRNRFRDLPKTDMKEILHQRMWESDSYKSHKDHMQLFKALEKSMNRDHSEKLAQDLAEARKKRKKSRELPKTPHGSPSHQPPPPHPPAGPSGASGAPRASGSAQMPPSLPPPSSTNQESPSKGSAAPNLEIDEDMAPDEQAQSSNDEDIGSAHIPIVNLRKGWWNPFEEERPTTPEPAWSIRSSDVPVPTNNWASALASNYSPPHEDSLLAQTDDITTFIDWFCKRRGITELKPQDLEGPAYEVVKVFQPDGRRPALSISKMKAAYDPDAGLEQMVPDQFWIEEECKYDIAAMYGHLNHLPPKDKKILTTVVNQWTRQLVTRQRIKDFQLGIESYQTQVNLTKPQWTTMGFEYKHDYTVIESPRAVNFWDKYGVQMMMRFNEIHKFSDGTLLQIDEALDYRVKEYRIKRLNPGLNTRFWTKKDVDRCNTFMFAIQRRLRTRRIFCNLVSFVGGRVREGDYRLLRRTD
nr:hypothetical protein [Tanacetum cinerariifolium]